MTKKSLDMDKFVDVFARKPRRIPGLILTCSDAQNAEWWIEMCSSDERLFLQWWLGLSV